MLAPIVIFAFNRPEALQKLLDSLRMNPFYEESDKYIFIDGPRCEEDKAKVDEVVTIARKVASNISISSVNRGLGNSIIAGVSTIIAEYGKAIVLEDDLICAPNFLSYMNQALDFYENDNKIISICGYGLKIKRPRGYVGDVYLLGRSSSWGWATWKDRWEQIDWDIQDWNEFSSNKQMRRAFNKNGSDMYSMLKGYMEGKNHSWAIRFCYNQFKLGKYSICPFISKVDNIGFGEEATNCKQRYSRFKVNMDIAHSHEFLFEKDIESNKRIEKLCYRYHSITLRLYSKIRKTLHI
jgi:hypothetical protein